MDNSVAEVSECQIVMTRRAFLLHRPWSFMIGPNKRQSRKQTHYPSTMDLAEMGSSVLDPYEELPAGTTR